MAFKIGRVEIIRDENGFKIKLHSQRKKQKNNPDMALHQVSCSWTNMFKVLPVCSDNGQLFCLCLTHHNDYD